MPYLCFFSSTMVEMATEKILQQTCSTLISIGNLKTIEPKEEIIIGKQRRESTKYEEEEKECSSILSVISNEEMSITSEILDQKSFVPRKGSDGEDLNGHIYHIDSPETDTYPNSEAFQGESLMDDISSMLGETMYGYDLESIDNTYSDETTLLSSEMTDAKLERKISLKRDSLDRKRRGSKVKTDDETQFGFENRAFMSQHSHLDNKSESEPAKYCSLAHFVEGNDIARRSFKRVRSTTKMLKTEANVSRQSTLIEESEVTPIGSCINLNKIEKELSNVSTSTLKALQAENEEVESETQEQKDGSCEPLVSHVV